MSGYQPRRGPNMNQYITNLNAIPSPQDSVPSQDFGNLEEELALFSNTEFLNEFDLGENEQLGEGFAVKNPPRDGKNVGFDDGFRMNEYQYVPSTTGPANLTPIQTFAGQGSPPFYAPNVNPQAPYVHSPVAASAPSVGDKRPASGPHSPSDPLEAGSRAAAEEDKRRRNTAASARFRIKKKQREQALEKTAKEMTDRADKLESKIAELERENKWLRSLVVEKSGTKEEDVSKLLDKVAQETRKGGAPKKGVGTEDDEAKAGSA